MKKIGETVQSLLGPASLGAIAGAVWALWGWPWGAIAAALPVASFYLWGEARKVAALPGAVE